MAGNMAKEIGAKVLVLNHISAKADGNGTNERSRLNEIIENASKAAGPSTRVVTAYDFMELLVPWLGFEDNTDAEMSADKDNEKGQVGTQKRSLVAFLSGLVGS